MTKRYYPRKIDVNQGQITRSLLAAGASVQSLHSLGGGVPDLLVGWRGWNILMEVKQPHTTLNAKERTWHNLWKGQKASVRDELEALQVLLEFTPHNAELQLLRDEFLRDTECARTKYKRLTNS